MRPILIAAMLVTAIPAGTPTAAQTTAIGATAAASDAQAAASRFVEAFNSPGSMRDFVASNFTQASLARETAELRAAPFDRLKQSAGGLRVLTATPQGDRMLELIAASAKGGKFTRIVLFTSAREPGKIGDIFLLSTRNPQRAAADAFPTTKVEENEIVTLARRRIDALAEEDRFSGTILIAHRDRILLREARGLADQSWQIPNRTTTRFHVASVGKMWTAVAVMRLAERGKLSLDDSVARWVPAYPHRAEAEKITLRMLLQHRGGIADWDGRRLGQLSSVEAAATMTEQPGEPDKGFSYSNAGYVLLAAAAEAASGMSFDQLIEAEVFKPAGMTRSGLWPVTAIVPDRATGYLRPSDDPLGFGPRFANDQFLGHGSDGSGGGYSTIDDMFAFNRALAGGRLVQSMTLKQMIDQSGEFPGAPRPARYGLGLNLTDCADVPTLGHGGGGQNSGVSAVTYASIDGEWTVIVLSNYDPPAAEELALDICELVHRR
ncbi:serine hydrolase domain-containing protein [Sphingomonas xanthus]|uniref:Beta-lactamase family protein n=1 Tax=Sphingomonas xanthus TaxID=2594473 RepID=A0A516IPE0_9SPHN|nr:serine hydrolase domain-containing protein [Sphingomonas xanthus]QDP18747.1 beta-lactamase family protein [Sphingomonas xanthus]